MQTEIGGRLVEWDDNKAATNVKKHGVSFRRAAEVFLDENRLDIADELHSYFEERRKTIGMVDGILVVIYTERAEATRLISARKATKKERMMYYGQYLHLPRHEN